MATREIGASLSLIVHDIVLCLGRRRQPASILALQPKFMRSSSNVHAQTYTSCYA